MLVKGQALLIVLVLLVIGSEPIGEAVGDIPDGLAPGSPGDSIPAVARTAAHCHGHALVLSRAPERGLSAPGVSNHRHPLSVNQRLRLKIVQNPAGRPGPHRDGAPAVSGPLAHVLGEQLVESCGKALVIVRRCLLGAEGRAGISPGHNGFRRIEGA